MSIIYMGFKGKMTKVQEPKKSKNQNFVIVWKGMDWSGFRTLTECEKQFPELEAQGEEALDHFLVVEK